MLHTFKIRTWNQAVVIIINNRMKQGGQHEPRQALHYHQEGSNNFLPSLTVPSVQGSTEFTLDRLTALFILVREKTVDQVIFKKPKQWVACTLFGTLFGSFSIDISKYWILYRYSIKVSKIGGDILFHYIWDFFFHYELHSLTQQYKTCCQGISLAEIDK